MKTPITIILIALFLGSCGPKRMKCYNKRCVETVVKKDAATSSVVNP